MRECSYTLCVCVSDAYFVNRWVHKRYEITCNSGLNGLSGLKVGFCCGGQLPPPVSDLHQNPAITHLIMSLMGPISRTPGQHTFTPHTHTLIYFSFIFGLFSCFLTLTFLPRYSPSVFPSLPLTLPCGFVGAHTHTLGPLCKEMCKLTPELSPVLKCLIHSL